MKKRSTSQRRRRPKKQAQINCWVVRHEPTAAPYLLGGQAPAHCIDRVQEGQQQGITLLVQVGGLVPVLQGGHDLTKCGGSSGHHLQPSQFQDGSIAVQAVSSMAAMQACGNLP